MNEARENYHKFCTEAAAKNNSSSDSDSDESGKEDGDEVEKEQPSSSSGTKREFEEKIAEEIAVECSEFESPFADGDWDNVPTFEQWAERMSQEYTRRRKFNNPKHQKSSKRQKFNEYKSMHFTEDKRMKMLKAFKESDEVKLQKKHEKYQDSLKNMKELRKGSKKLKFMDIPWPCPRGTLKDMIDVIMKGLDSGADEKQRKKYIVRQMLLWHSDKFKQHFDHLLHEDDREVILKNVDDICKELNKLKDCDPNDNITVL